MSGRVTLVGLDFGSTTSSALVSTARLVQRGVNGACELVDVVTVQRAGPIFTPFAGDALDLDELARAVDGWLAAAPAPAWGGGALVTGLAARAPNADGLVELVRARLGDAVVATARDPGLESWLAFMGSCRALSLAEPARWFLNVDIGGGTSNFALGRAGEVEQVGCVAVGARHVRVTPGGYRVTGASKQGQELITRVGAGGVELEIEQVRALVRHQVDALGSMARGKAAPWQELALAVPAGIAPVVTFSGGVGELVYRLARGERPDARTPYGDLGVELAEALLASPLAAHVRTHAPAGSGYATVSGLALFATEVSGATLYLPRPEALPLRDLPVVARLGPDATDAELAHALELIRRSAVGGAVALDPGPPSLERVRALGARLSQAFAAAALPTERPVVLLVAGNVGKTLGSLASGWGRAPVHLVVVDEVPGRRAHFVTLGVPRHGVVPLAFHGLW